VSVGRALHFLLPGDPETPTGGYIYDRRIVRGLVNLGWRVTVHSLDPGFPFPTGHALDTARAVLEGIADGAPVVIDGLALGAMPELAEDHADRLGLVALIHHPLAMETGLPAGERQRLEHSEQRALAAVDRIVVTSQWTKRALVERGIPVERIGAVIPGTDPAPVARGSAGPGLNLLCVATLTPRKGHAVLIDALAGLRDRDWQLYCVGSLDRDTALVTDLRDRIEGLDLGSRISLVGEVPHDEVDRHYDHADLFVLATHLEGYGMALAEALSRGIPVISSSAGAVPDTVPADAGILVSAGDVHALRRALATVMNEPKELARLRQGAARARERLPGWEQASALFAAELGRLP